MKVGLVVPGGVDRGGTERVIPILLALVERVAREHELHVFTLTQEERPARWRRLGATVHNAGIPWPRPRALAALLREHRRAPFDVLHGVWSIPGMVACVAGRVTGCPVLLHLVGGDLASLPRIGYGLLQTRRGRWQLRAAAALASHVTVNSGYTQRAAAALGIRAERVPYGVSVRDWPALPPRRREAGAEARLLFVGSLNRVKDPGTLLRGAARLRERGVRFRLDVIGADTLGGEARALAGELGLDGVVRFHGFLAQDELRPWMERADVLVVTSLHECGPIVALEAALAGVPTVGTPVGHLADWAPRAAVAVPTGDAEALAGAVAALLADEERRLGLALAAQRRALADDADAAARRVMEIYQELTRTHHTSPMTEPCLKSDPAADAAYAVTIPVFGIPTRFESNSAEVIEVVEEGFGGWSALASEPRWIGATAARVRVDVVPGDEGAEDHVTFNVGIPRKTTVVITTPGSRGYADALRRESVAEVSEALLRDRQHFRYGMLESLALALLSRLDREPLHAAAVVRGETALLLAAPSGTGKSTLVYAAARSGLKVLTDDAVFLQLHPFRVWGMPSYLHVPTDSRAYFPELDATAPAVRANGKIKIAVSLRELGAVAPRPVVDHAGICLLARGDGRPRLEALSPEAVAHALTDNLEPGFDLFADTIGERARHLGERGGWRLHLPEHPNDALPFLHEMFDALERE